MAAASAPPLQFDVPADQCKHLATPCDIRGCECWCDACQKVFEDRWNQNAEIDHLCWECGMPLNRPLTVEALKVTENSHFYDPCAKCRPAYEALMREKRLCTMCPSGIPEKGSLICSDCTCTKKEGCECRVCEMRAAAATAPQLNTSRRPDEGAAAAAAAGAAAAEPPC